MTSVSFDFAPLLAPGTPAPAVKWNGFPKYNFIGGHNDAEQVPVDELIAAATSVLKREGRTLATYGLNSGPLGYRPLREFLAGKLKSHAGIACTRRRDPDHLGLAAGPRPGEHPAARQGRHRPDRAGDLRRRAEPARQVRRQRRRHPARRGRHAHGRAEGQARGAEGKGVKPKYIYTIPTVQNPTGSIMAEARRAGAAGARRQYGTMIFEDECYSDLIWTGKRPPSIYSLAGGEGVIFIGSFSKSIAPALRVGYIVAKWEILARILGAQAGRRLGRARADGAGRVLHQAFRRPCAQAQQGAERTSCRPCARRWPSSSARPPSSAIRRAASISGSSCPTMSTR